MHKTLRALTWTNLPLRAKGYVVVAIPMVALAAVAIQSYHAKQADEATAVQQRRELQTLAAAQRVLGLTLDEETGVRGYLLTGREEYLSPYQSALRSLGPAVSQLEADVRDQPAQSERVKDLEVRIMQRQQVAGLLLLSARPGVSTTAQQGDLLAQGKGIQDGLRQDLAAVEAESQVRIQSGLTHGERLHRQGIVMALVGALAGLAAGLVATGLFRTGIVRRVGLLQDDARSLALGKPLAALTPATDELGRLGFELQRTGEILRDQKERLKLVLEATGIVLWEYDASTNTILWPENDLTDRQGRTPEVLPSLLSSIHADDRERVEEAFRAAAGNGVLDSEFRVFLDGGLHWFHAIGRLANDHQGRARLVGWVIDATGQKGAELAMRESEALKTAILSSMGDGVLITDDVGTIVSINPAMEGLAGWSNDEVRGRPFDFYTMFDARLQPMEPGQHLLARAMASGQAQATRGYGQTILTRDNRRVPWAGTASPIIDNHGILVGWVEVFRNVAFEQEVDQLKSSLVSTVSHELRTPLTMIQGFSELILTRKPSPEKTEEALRHINTSAQRLARLIDDLLTVSRIESGRSEVRAGPCDLHQVLEEIVAQFRGARRVEVEVDAGLPAVLADPDMLVQILTNLVSNAIKYSGPDTAVCVAGGRQAGMAEISVTDHGLGMSATEQANLFQRFFRADRAEVQKVGGTGLGLYITKNLVEMHGGRLWVKTELGVGSTFTFSLPLA